MSEMAIEAALRRDRAIVAAALIILTALTWAYVWRLAADMDMGDMDMSGFRIIPAGMGLMMPATAPWNTVEFAFVFAVGRHDDRHDDPIGDAHDLDLCPCRPAGSATGDAIGGERLFCR